LGADIRPEMAHMSIGLSASVVLLKGFPYDRSFRGR
jgi:hypothetical protein